MKTRTINLIIVAGFVFLGCGPVYAGTAQEAKQTAACSPAWQEYKGDRVILVCSPDVNLRRLEGRLRSRWFTVSAAERDLFTNPAYSVDQRILARLESILLRVEQVLGMDLPSLTLRVKVYATRDALTTECLRLYGTAECYRSFYVHGLETIYTSVQDVTDSQIAHEMAHAVIDNYFKVIPPERTAEFLATYVDSHLEDREWD
jgi:hypothetical protein